MSPDNALKYQEGGLGEGIRTGAPVPSKIQQTIKDTIQQVGKQLTESSRDPSQKNRIQDLSDALTNNDINKQNATNQKAQKVRAFDMKTTEVQQAQANLAAQNINLLQKVGLQKLSPQQQQARDELAKAKIGADVAAKEIGKAVKDEDKIVQQERSLIKDASKEITQTRNVTIDNMKQNIFLDKPQVFKDTEDARREIENYRQWVLHYEKELKRIRDLIKAKDDKQMLYELAKYVKPQPVEEEQTKDAQLSTVLLGGGASYMSRLDRILQSLEMMMQTLNDQQNSLYISEKQASSLRDRIQELGIMGKELDTKVQEIDFPAAVGRDFDDDNAYDIPPELINRYPPEVIEKARLIIMLIAFFKNAANKYSLAPVSVATCSLLALLCVIGNILLTLIFVVTIIFQFKKGRLIKNPINMQSQDFRISRMGTFRGSYAFVFLVFILLNALAVILGVVGFMRMVANNQVHHQRTPTLVKAVLFASLCQGLIGFIASLVITIILMKRLRSSAQRIQSFNKFVYQNMYKDTKFLKNLRSIPSNSFSLMTVVKNALSTLSPKATEDDIGKAVFSINLYMHFQNMGYRNPYLLEALSKTFNVSGLLRKNFFAPANFLHRRVTFIKDNGDIMRDNLVRLAGNRPSQDVLKRIDTGIMKASEWTAEANNLANSFYPEESMRIFLGQFVLVFITQTLPLLIFMYIFRDVVLQKGFIVAMSVLFGKKK